MEAKIASGTIPVKKGLPWIGEALAFGRDPIQALEGFVGYDEVVEFTFFGSPAYAVTHPDLVRELLVTKARSFRKSDIEVENMGRFLGNGLVTNNDQQFHKRQRRLAQPAFHMQRIASYADVIVDYSRRLCEAWRPGEVVDVSEAMRELTMYIVAKTLFDADQDNLSDSAREIGHAVEIFQRQVDRDFNLPFRLPEWIPTKSNRQAREGKQVIEGTLLDIIQQRRRSGEDRGDLLSMLLLGQDETGSGMSDRQLLDEVVTLFLAGHETTSNALTWTWYLLAHHPQVAQRLHAEIDTVLDGRMPTLTDLERLPYGLMVLKESMRLYPPVYALNGRVSNEPVQLGDYHFPANSFFIVSQWTLHHDPRWFPDPLKFEPERFSAENEADIPRYAYIPFGAGPRVCIGAAFAMMEAHLILATVRGRYDLELLPNQDIRLNPRITLSPKNGLLMRARPR